MTVFQRVPGELRVSQQRVQLVDVAAVVFAVMGLQRRGRDERLERIVGVGEVWQLDRHSHLLPGTTVRSKGMFGRLDREVKRLILAFQCNSFASKPMDISLARTFLEIVATVSFLRAAERLHVTQTAVSARVRTLKDLLGRRLFVRNKSGASLTPAGEQFLRYAPTLVQGWERARHQVAVPSGRRAIVTVGCEIRLVGPAAARLAAVDAPRRAATRPAHRSRFARSSSTPLTRSFRKARTQRSWPPALAGLRHVAGSAYGDATIPATRKRSASNRRRPATAASRPKSR